LPPFISFSTNYHELGFAVALPRWGLSRAHTTAKAGIIGMTRQLAMEGREHGIRANSISPGVIETNQTREHLKDLEWAGHMLGKTLLGHLGRPEEAANVALFLASDKSSYVTGVDIVVDGGMKVW
jgi:NAD(P)-dependent dehydrogenase (short-subunit alcohol dehydrogenase family)